MISRAPAKVVVWGEYAVLDGAPAGVMAIDRYASVSLHPAPQCEFTIAGPLLPNFHGQPQEFTRTAATAIIDAILDYWGYDRYPQNWAIHIDTSSMHDKLGHKYGIGSSAAAFVAVYGALAQTLQRPTSIAEVMSLHRNWQGKKGSGLDVAAAWTGGFIHFQDSKATAAKWPATWQFRVVWTGSSTSTPAQLQSFSDWLANADRRSFDALCAASNTLFDALADAADPLEVFAPYCSALETFDREASLNIYSNAHRHLQEAAAKAQVVYKPCGAGGGDIGIAISDNTARLEAFCRQAEASPFTILPTEIAAHGVHIN